MQRTMISATDLPGRVLLERQELQGESPSGKPVWKRTWMRLCDPRDARTFAFHIIDNLNNLKESQREPL